MSDSKKPGKRTSAPPHDDSGPRALARLLALFDALSLASNGMTLAELNVALESPKSSLLNLLRPLVAEGFLVHSAGTYNLWPLDLSLVGQRPIGLPHDEGDSAFPHGTRSAHWRERNVGIGPTAKSGKWYSPMWPRQPASGAAPDTCWRQAPPRCQPYRLGLARLRRKIMA